MNFAAWIQEARRRIQGMVSRAVVRNVSETGKLRTLQLETYAGELLDGVEHFEPYGFTAAPPILSEGVVVNAGGERTGAVAIVVGDRRYRLLGLASGEVALYDSGGQRIVLRASGEIEINAQAAVKITAPTVSCSGSLEVAKDVMDGATSPAPTMELMRAVFNSHNHGAGPPPHQSM